MLNITDLESLLTKHEENIIFRCIAGSRAYGTATEISDTDIRGIFILPAQNYLSIVEPIKMVSDLRGDIVFYTLNRFLQLASLSNPNIIELLFLPSECILKLTPYAEQLILLRNIFISKRAYDTHINYALSQIKRARGQNKWVNNPKPKASPSKENFCWIIPKNENQNYAFRPVTLSKSGVELSGCHVSSLEHAKNIYRLYFIGDGSKGVFRGDNIVCQSISKEEEVLCIGLLVYNKEGYEAALKEHCNYWTWRKNRNEQRWVSQESGSLDYDAKNIMHMFRLLISGENILRDGCPLVRFEGNNLKFLLDILNRSFKYDELMNMANEKMTMLADLYNHCHLPENPNINKINTLLYELTCQWKNNHA